MVEFTSGASVKYCFSATCWRGDVVIRFLGMDAYKYRLRGIGAICNRWAILFAGVVHRTDLLVHGSLGPKLRSTQTRPILAAGKGERPFGPVLLTRPAGRALNHMIPKAKGTPFCQFTEPGLGLGLSARKHTRRGYRALIATQ